jgi:hypothetical protein
MKIKFCEYCSRNAFFYLYWENDTSLLSSSGNFLMTSSKIRRVVKPSRKGQRSKYVVRPETVVVAGNHVVWKFVPGDYP